MQYGAAKLYPFDITAPTGIRDVNGKTRFLSVIMIMALGVAALDLGIAGLVHRLLIG
jgi:hypothetical protein